MTKICLLCGKPIESIRNTKKYCSNNCKQLAFYKRSGLQLSEIIVKEPFNDMIPPANNASIKYTDQPLANSTPLATAEIHDLLLNDHPAIAVNNVVAVKQQEEEPVYEWVHSYLLDRIIYYTDNSNDLSMFQYPQKYWRADTLPTVKWVSLRIRCLLESLIRLSNSSFVIYADLIAVKEALNALIASQHFNNLPNNYPYITLIKELQQKLTLTSKQFKRKQSISFCFTLNRKAELIAKRHILAGFVPTIKFSLLHIND